MRKTRKRSRKGGNRRTAAVKEVPREAVDAFVKRQPLSKIPFRYPEICDFLHTDDLPTLVLCCNKLLLNAEAISDRAKNAAITAATEAIKAKNLIDKYVSAYEQTPPINEEAVEKSKKDAEEAVEEAVEHLETVAKEAMQAAEEAVNAASNFNAKYESMKNNQKSDEYYQTKLERMEKTMNTLESQKHISIEKLNMAAKIAMKTRTLWEKKKKPPPPTGAPPAQYTPQRRRAPPPPPEAPPPPPEVSPPPQAPPPQEAPPQEAHPQEAPPQEAQAQAKNLSRFHREPRNNETIPEETIWNLMDDNSTFTLKFLNKIKDFTYDDDTKTVIGNLLVGENDCIPCWQITRKTQEFEIIVDSLSKLNHIEPNWRDQIRKQFQKGGKRRKTRRKRRRN